MNFFFHFQGHWLQMKWSEGCIKTFTCASQVRLQATTFDWTGTGSRRVTEVAFAYLARKVTMLLAVPGKKEMTSDRVLGIRRKSQSGIVALWAIESGTFASSTEQRRSFGTIKTSATVFLRGRRSLGVQQPSHDRRTQPSQIDMDTSKSTKGTKRLESADAIYWI
jgi:hypothetical protein